MSHTIHPYSSSRPPLQPRTEAKSESDEEHSGVDALKTGPGAKTKSPSSEGPVGKPASSDEPSALQGAASRPAPEAEEQTAPAFKTTLDGALETGEPPDNHTNSLANLATELPGLTRDEQQMIYRYFPASPSLELRLYRPDLSTNKVDPGSVGSRVDLRG